MDTSRPVVAQGAARALVVLAVLVGLFAMHGLSTTHDALFSSSLSMAMDHAAMPARPLAAAGMGAQLRTAHPGLVALAAPAGRANHSPARAVAVAQPSGSGPGGAMDMAATCLAVLLAVGVLVAASACRRQWWPTPGPATRAPLHAPACVPRRHCLLLVELSICRT